MGACGHRAHLANTDELQWNLMAVRDVPLRSLSVADSCSGRMRRPHFLLFSKATPTAPQHTQKCHISTSLAWERFKVCLAQAGLELLTLLPHPTQPWDPRQFVFLFVSFFTFQEKKPQVPGRVDSGGPCGCALNWHGLLFQYRLPHISQPSTETHPAPSLGHTQPFHS